MLHSFVSRLASRATLTRVIVYAILYACCLGIILWLAYKLAGEQGSFRIIELEPAWHPGNIAAHFAGLTDVQRIYTKWMLLVDVLNITAYTFMFATLIAWIYKKRYAVNNRKMLWCLVPFVMAFFDLFENLLMCRMMISADMPVAQVLNGVILAKLAAGAVCGVVIVGGVVRK